MATAAPRSAVVIVAVGMADRPGAVGPPPASVADEAAEVAPFVTGTTLGRIAQKGPAGTEEELLEVGLEGRQPVEVGEEVRAGRSIPAHTKEVPILGLAPPDLERLAVARKCPDLLVHGSIIGPTRSGTQTSAEELGPAAIFFCRCAFSVP
jgi:hypothetical protein